MMTDRPGGWLAYRTSLRWSSAFSDDLAANSLLFSCILYCVFFTSLNADSCFLSSVAAYSYDGSCRVGCGLIELSCRPDWLMLLRLRFWTGWTLVAHYFVAAYLNEMRCRIVDANCRGFDDFGIADIPLVAIFCWHRASDGGSISDFNPHTWLCNSRST